MRTTTLRFWGVRGSVPCPGPATARYGGNTPCIELRCGEHLIILDAGTGLRPLGGTLDGGVDADLFLSHCHIDHICGLPFFAPFYEPTTRLRLWAGNLMPEHKLIDVMHRLMDAPLFPTGFAPYQPMVECRDFHSGETLRPHPDVTVRTAQLNHPDRSTGYRVEHAGHVIAYITDTEHEPGAPDRNAVALAANADMMIYDCTYTDAEFEDFRGRGHSTWQEGARLADLAGAKRLILFHHDPDHDDEFLDRVAAEAEALRPGTLVAAEGMVLRLPA
jgi:phosphoribosyl 1,2-cyclic phosphodiesterase